MKTFQSTPITFIDQTDSRKLEVYVKSNLPTVQIYNSNTGAFTPDWTSGEGLTLNADVFLDSRVMTNTEYNDTLIKWYKDDVEIQSNRNKQILKITSNELDYNPIITYSCEATYQGIVASTRVTYARVDTGADGSDGTSVRILGTAEEVHGVEGTNYHTITYSSGAIVAAALGDAYVGPDGHLYVCAVLNGDGTKDYFIDVGPFKGDPGDPAKNIVLVASSQVFKVEKDGTTINPQNITITAHPANLTSEEQKQIQWAYRYNATGSWLNITETSTVSGLTLKNNVITINRSAMTSSVASVVLRATFGDAEDALTIYKVFDGVKGDSASMAFLTNENTSFASLADGKLELPTTFYTNVVSYNGTAKVTPTIGAIASLPSGMSVHPNKGTAYTNVTLTPANAVLTTLYSDSGLKTAINKSTLKTGDSFVVGDFLYKYDATSGNFKSDTVSVGSETYLDRIVTNNEILLLFTVAKEANLGSTASTNGEITIPITSPVSTNLLLSWSKINSGAKGDIGVSINSPTVSYAKSNSPSPIPANDQWSGDIPEVGEDEYLWTRTIIDYTDPKKEDTVAYTYSKQGKTGGAGTSVKVESIEYKEGTSATDPPDGKWSSAPVVVADGNYLWTKTTFSDGNIAYGVAKQGSNGSSATLVDITPSAMYFKSTTGGDGTFTPTYIYLYPRFQNTTYSNWQYSIDGGTTWLSVGGASGLSVGTYNSVDYTLRVARNSTLYTSDITSISFKCNSTNSAIYDVVSIAKIYDVVDLTIGARNLARLTNSEHWSHYPPSTGRTSTVTTSKGARGVRVRVECISTDVSETATFGTQQVDDARIMKLKSGETYTLSFLARGNVSNLNYAYLMNSDGVSNQGLGGIASNGLSTTNFVKYSKTFIANENVDLSTGSFIMISYRGPIDPSLWFEIEEVQIEAGNTSTDWTPAPEDLLDEAANVNVMLSNEAHFFEATAGGVPIDTSVTLDVVGYKGSVKSETIVGTISGIPSAGMTASVTNNGTTNTKLTISVTPALTSDIADFGILTIPITVNGHTINKIFNWTKAKEGDAGTSGSDAVTFQVYSNNGYALSTTVPTIPLQTFAYVGDVEIAAGATYQWYRSSGASWSAISGATNDYLNVSRDDVAFSNNYMCKMNFGGLEYTNVVTIDDKNDENKVFAAKPSNYFAGDLWVVGTDYVPSGFTVGTMLRAEHTNRTYADADWVSATKYDEEIDDLKNAVDTYKEYFSIDEENGLQIGDASINDNVLTVRTVDTTTVNAREVNIESPLNITGKYSGSTMLQAPVINLGQFSLVVESNGSLSIVKNA